MCPYSRITSPHHMVEWTCRPSVQAVRSRMVTHVRVRERISNLVTYALPPTLATVRWGDKLRGQRRPTQRGRRRPTCLLVAQVAAESSN